MSPRIKYLELAEAVQGAANDVSNWLTRRIKRPTHFYHYTSKEGFEGIIKSSELWAKSLADQKDEAELQYALTLIDYPITEIRNSSTHPFTRLVLSQISIAMRERRQWMFITCFTSISNSRFHWNNYGKYCLTFTPTAEDLRIRCQDYQASTWFQPVIYNKAEQEIAIASVLRRMILALEANIGGDFEGPWVKGQAENTARCMGQILLYLASSMKKESFAPEQEWRLVTLPHLGALNIAPGSYDQSLSSCISSSPFRHLKLTYKPPVDWSSGAITSFRQKAPLPISCISLEPGLRNEKELLQVEGVLLKYGYES